MTAPSDPTSTPGVPTPPTVPTTTEPTPSTPPDPDPDAGAKKALDAERKARRDAELAAKKLEAELADLRKSQMSDQEKALADARQEGETAAETRLRARLVAAEVRALATGKTIDPDLVATLIDPASLKWDGDQIDPESVTKAIDKIIAAKPYLATTAPGPAAPVVPKVPAGARGSSSIDVDQMSMSEYIAARKAGTIQ